MTIITIRKCSFFFTVILINIFVQVCGLEEQKECITPITMTKKTIKDEQYLASSTLNHVIHGPHKARSSENSRWCPGNNFVSLEGRQWIEIDLREVYMIKALTIDATFLNLSRPNFQYYDFEYYRPRLRKWISKWHMFVGDQKYNETSNLKHPVWASKIRIVVQSHFNEAPCISFELFGCLWTKGIVSYDMPVNDLGDRKFYDGITEGGFKKDGLGQLVDGKVVSQNKDSMDGWLAWKNDSLKGHPLKLTYEFDQLHEFHSIIVSVKFDESKEIKGFSYLEVYFSNDGFHYSIKPLRHYYEYTSSLSIQNVTVDLKRNTGRFVILKLYFAGRWMYISEINFENNTVDPWVLAGKLGTVVVITAVLLCLLIIGPILYYLILRRKCLTLFQNIQGLKFPSLQIHSKNGITRFYTDVPECLTESGYLEPNEPKNVECYDPDDGIYEKIRYSKIGKQ